MRKILIWLVVLPSFCFGQHSFNMTFLSNFELAGLPSRFGAEYNDCWGYRHANGTEVAIIGGIEDIFFVNITSPANPVLIYTHHVTNISGTTNQSLWRDFKTYQHYAYAAADEGDSGLLIFDLSNVPASVTLAHQTNAFWSRTHNIFIDTLNARLYAAGSNTQSNGLRILDLSVTPANPTQLASMSLQPHGGGYVHDVYVRDNIAYCSHAGLSKLQIYNMTNPANISVVGVIDNYPEEGYNHSSWVNDAGTYLVMADETHGSDLKFVDITDPENISINDIRTFYSELEGASAPGSSIAHNPFIKGDLVYISYYHDGVQVFDISDPEDIGLVAYYDTYPENTGYSGYDGCWGVYPYFPSGVIIASDQNNGLFMLQITNEVLDINFLSFDAKRRDGHIQLNWSVADAAFGNRFEVKRSSNGGIVFETIGTVPLTASEGNYSFQDHTASPNEKFLYRIDFVELDGKRIPSPVRSISTEKAVSVVSVSNPVRELLTIDILAPLEYLEMNIHDIEGKLVWAYFENEPVAHFEKNIAGIAPGNYVLTAAWPGGNVSMLLQVTGL